MEPDPCHRVVQIPRQEVEDRLLLLRTEVDDNITKLNVPAAVKRIKVHFSVMWGNVLFSYSS